MASDAAFPTSTVVQANKSLMVICPASVTKRFKVRSTKGLMVQLFGKIAAAFIYLIF